MRDQLVRLSESGQGLNNNLKLIIVAGASFLFGVAATYTYQSSELSNPVLTPRQKELQKIAIEAERRPFFPAPIPLMEETHSKNLGSESSKPVESFDYVKSNIAVKNFQKNLDLETQKSFETVSLREKIHSRKREYILSKVDYFLSSKNSWFKAVFNGPEIHPVKLTFFMRAYACTKNGIEAIKTGRPKIEDVCYSFSSYSHLRDKWNYYSIVTNFTSGEWRDDIFYTSINTDEMGEFSQETNVLRAYVPMADDGGVIRFLKYENNKFEWVDGGELKWSPSNEAEARKFEKLALPDAVNYND